MGRKHGIGKFIWADGSTYEGEFQDNNVHKYFILYPRSTEMELIVGPTAENLSANGKITKCNYIILTYQGRKW